MKKTQKEIAVEPRACAVCAGTGKVTEAIDGYLYEVPCEACTPPSGSRPQSGPR